MNYARVRENFEPYLQQNNANKLEKKEILNSDNLKEFTKNKLTLIYNNESQMNQILIMRQQVLELRHNAHVDMLNQMLVKSIVSPRTYQIKKIEIDFWWKKELSDIKKAEQIIEEG